MTSPYSSRFIGGGPLPLRDEPEAGKGWPNTSSVHTSPGNIERPHRTGENAGASAAPDLLIQRRGRIDRLGRAGGLSA